MTDTPRTDDYESQDKEHHEEWEEAHCAWEWARVLERELKMANDNIRSLTRVLKDLRDHD